jgi:hypothetical protein
MLKKTFPKNTCYKKSKKPKKPKKNETETDPDRKPTFEQETDPDPDRSQKVKPAGIYDT